LEKNATVTLRTRLTEKLNITHPVLLAPMGSVSGGRLAGAVSEAGGLGLIGGGYGDRDWLEREFAAAGNRRVGCGFITWSLAKEPGLLDVALARRPAALMLSFGDPRPFAKRIQAEGVVLMCQVQSRDHTLQALDAGAEIIVAQGTEAGGHGASRTTLDVVPAIVDLAAGDVPVVAAGGIADGRGLAAMLMLGASGVLLGTRFYASQEADIAEEAKQRVCAAGAGSTVRGIIFDLSRNNVWPAPFTGRCLVNDHARRWMGREVALMQNVREVAAEYAVAKAASNFDVAAVIAGEAASLIHDIPPAAEVVARIAGEAEQIISGRRNSSTSS
jgi:nitronate monooxygenase